MFIVSPEGCLKYLANQSICQTFYKLRSVTSLHAFITNKFILLHKNEQKIMILKSQSRENMKNKFSVYTMIQMMVKNSIDRLFTYLFLTTLLIKLIRCSCFIRMGFVHWNFFSEGNVLNLQTVA
ncbi:hypothetical protein PR048_011718 [Dryococelus australis]|uniref:Uncharacterized protein n=1 Tax=Dryococelus australis TaxID=614101 RepID=A0ABQ9HMW0_9NEOP|nr:hypothetical protein PR048_011718 [Dryococelus australis]